MKFNLYRYAWGKNSIFTKQMLKMLAGNAFAKAGGLAEQPKLRANTRQHAPTCAGSC